MRFCQKLKTEKEEMGQAGVGVPVRWSGGGGWGEGGSVWSYIRLIDP